MLQDPENDASYFEYNFPGISIIYKAGAFIKPDMMVDLDDYDGPPERYDSDADGWIDEFEDSDSEYKVDRYWVDGYQQEESYTDTSPWHGDESSLDESSGTDS